MTVLVLGATGNTGTEVVKQLHDLGIKPKVMLRDVSKAEALHVSEENVRVGDFDSVEALTNAMNGVEKLYLAMPASEHNEIWVRNVLAAMQTAGVKHIVKLSGFGAHESAGSEIIRVHAATDALIKESGVRYTLLQPNSFFQNLYGSLTSIQTTGQFYLPLANAKQSVVDIRDVAAVAVAALTEAGHDNQVYKLSGPEALTFAQQADILAAKSGKPVDYVAVPEAAAAEAMKGAGMPVWLAEKLAEILAWFAQGAYAEVTDTVERVLGRPARRFDVFADEFVQAL